MSKVIYLNDIKIHSIIEHLKRLEYSSKRYKRDVQRAINEAKTKKPSLQLYNKIKAIIIKVLCSVNLSDHNTHFIIENILTQTTYYKTLTSRP